MAVPEEMHNRVHTQAERNSVFLNVSVKSYSSELIILAIELLYCQENVSNLYPPKLIDFGQSPIKIEGNFPTITRPK